MDPQIHEWQKAILPNADSEEAISIAKVFSGCSDLWGFVTRILTRQEWVQKGTIQKLESAHSYIRLWADGYDVLGGQFEKHLKNSQRAGDMTIRLLQNICRTLTQELIPVATSLSTLSSQDATSLSLKAADLALTSERLAVLVQGDNDSDASDDGEVLTSSESVPNEKLLDDIADDLRNDTQCLLDLGPRFEEQVTNPIASEAAANPLSSSDRGLADTFIKRILHLYPQCESDLAGRLGTANWLRMLKIAECKPRTGDGRITNRDNNITHDSAETESVVLGSVTDILSTEEQSLFHDSGVGSTSNISVSHSDEHLSRSEIQSHPPLPDGAMLGKPFRCTVCKCHITIMKPRDWRAHLLRDLLPYVCPEIGCDMTFFSHHLSLERHMRYSHPASAIWKDSKCRICGETVSAPAMLNWRHLETHMEAIALAIIPQGVGGKIDMAPVCDAQDKEETQTSSFTANKTSRYEKILARTGCNTCKWKRIRCDEKRPSCGSCVRSGAICEGYSRPPRPWELGSDSKLVDISAQPAQPHDAETKNATRRYPNEEWFPLFPETDGKVPLGVSIQGSLTEPLPKDDFVKPPLPSRTPIPLFSSTDTMRQTDTHDSLDPIEGFQTFSWQDNPFLRSPPAEPEYILFDAPGYAHHDSTRVPINTEPVVSSRRRNNPLPPIVVDDLEDTVNMKRARNTLAARKSRERKAQRLEELEEKIAKLEQERDKWKNVAVEHGAELL